ncbi:MAG TPA: hypothetical protein VFT95_17465 [Micromonosporaceae bacterium]|nr:hypothetical protein [Micromonosporaceae bacterium]
MYASADGGTTWEPRASVDLGGPLLSILPTADGALLLEGPKDTYRSLDGGRTFTRVGPSLGNHGYTLATGGYAIPTNNSEYGVWLSPDGAAWSYVSRPEVP